MQVKKNECLSIKKRHFLNVSQLLLSLITGNDIAVLIVTFVANMRRFFGAFITSVYHKQNLQKYICGYHRRNPPKCYRVITSWSCLREHLLKHIEFGHSDIHRQLGQHEKIILPSWHCYSVITVLPDRFCFPNVYCHAYAFMNDLGFEFGLGLMFIIVLLYFCTNCELFFGVVLLLFPVL